MSVASADTPRSAAERSIPAVLWDEAVDLLGGEDAARRWFAAPLRGLDGRSPAEAVRTEDGRRVVAAIFGRVRHGVVG